MNQYSRIYAIRAANRKNLLPSGVMEPPALINSQRDLALALKRLAEELNADPEDTMVQLFQAQAPKAMVVITELMLDEDSPPSVRLRAAEHIMGRAIGPITGKFTIKSSSDKLYDEIIEMEVVRDEDAA